MSEQPDTSTYVAKVVVKPTTEASQGPTQQRQGTWNKPTENDPEKVTLTKKGRGTKGPRAKECNMHKGTQQPDNQAKATGVQSGL